jgi:uncharacterized coiled-coil DUF342 family protein
MEAALLEELELKRERENVEAERRRRRRDELNEKTRGWVEKRDELNAQARAFVEQASRHRQRRDELNAQVQEAKAERDKWNRKVAELQEKLSDLKRKRLPRRGVPLGKLKRELRALEFRQQTTVLTVEKERELVEMLSRLKTEIEQREKELEENEEIRAVLEDVRKARDTAEAFHKQVGELADKAQKEHDEMVALYEKSDEVRRLADQAQEEFIKTKMAADEEHRKHIEHIRQVHDYDKIIHGIRQKTRFGAAYETEESMKRQAEEIFDRFKRGEKLSTEDLMTLQKSGYL